MVRRYSSSKPTKDKLFRVNENLDATIMNIASSTGTSANYIVNDALANYAASPELWPKTEQDLDAEIDDAIQIAINKLGGSS